MKKQLLRSVFVITAVWLLICAGYLLFMQRKEIVADRGEKLVLLNEVEQLTKNEDGSNPAQAEIEALRETLKEDTPEGKRSYTIQVTVTCGVIIFFYMLFIFFYLYRNWSSMRGNWQKEILTFRWTMKEQTSSGHLPGRSIICARN